MSNRSPLVLKTFPRLVRANFKLKICRHVSLICFKYPNLIEAIIEDDSFEWTDEDLAKLTNGNILRVFRDLIN